MTDERYIPDYTRALTVGLKTATPEDIRQIILDAKAQGVRLIHKTLRRDGTKLPYNGVLIPHKNEACWRRDKYGKI